MTPLGLAAAALHLGQLHAHEQVVVLLVAFGPFAVLVVVVLVLRHRAEARSRRAVEPPARDGRGAS